MDDWKSMLKADPTDWLLKEDNPSVRYFALRDLLDRPEEDAQVMAARERIMETGLVPQILSSQREPSYLDGYPGFYTRKYEGLSWTLIVLAELGAKANAQIMEQCQYIADYSQELSEGGFSQHAAAKTGGGRISEVIPCLTGNMVWSLIRLGLLHDPRVQKGIQWLVTYLRLNDGVESEPQAFPYSKLEMCWGSHTCHMGVVKALKAFGAIPLKDRTPSVHAAIRRAAEFMLIHHVYKRSHNLSRTSKPGWLMFGFPLMYQSDALEILDILTGLGYKDSRMQDAVLVVLGKQGGDGRWQAENTYNNDRLLIPLDAAEQSRWLTLRAMRVLKRYHSA